MRGDDQAEQAGIHRPLLEPALSAYSQQDLDRISLRISLRINTMPRRLHQWDSAKDRYDAAVVALTA